jgi:histone H3/H4
MSIPPPQSTAEPKGEPPGTPRVEFPYTLAEALEVADIQVQSAPRRNFSREAFDELQAAIHKYIADLIAASAQLSRRQGVDTVSTAHVVNAARNLNLRTDSRRQKIVGSLGALLTGSFFPKLLESQNVGAEPLSIAWILVGLVGVGLMVADWRG